VRERGARGPTSWTRFRISGAKLVHGSGPVMWLTGRTPDDGWTGWTTRASFPSEGIRGQVQHPFPGPRDHLPDGVPARFLGGHQSFLCQTLPKGTLCERGRSLVFDQSLDLTKRNFQLQV
jgi:hypothetical protein